MKKTLVVLFMVATFVFSLVACGSQTQENTAGEETIADEGEESRKKIVTIGVQSGGSYWGNVEQGFTEACEELGWIGEYWTPQNAGNDAEMVELAENALTQRFDAICMEINDLDMYGDFIERAQEQGVVIISMTDIGEEYCDAFVGIDAYASGYSNGEQVAKFAEELGYEAINYVMLMSATDNASQQKNRDGMKDALTKNFIGEVNEVEVVATDSNAATAQDKINAYYLANPELNAMGTADIYGALGAAQFVSENNLQGEFIAFGLELTEDAFHRVLDGDLIATSSVDSVGIGKNFVQIADKISKGEDFEYSNPASKIWVFKDTVEAYCAENGIELNR